MREHPDAILTLQIRGIPAPQGSKRHVGGGAMIESSKKVEPWREAVRTETQAARIAPMEGPIRVTVTFWLVRPKRHFRTNGELHKWAPDLCHTRPDLDKLLRSTLDGLKTGGAYLDDSQVVEVAASKHYCPIGFAPGASVQVTHPGLP